MKTLVLNVVLLFALAALAPIAAADNMEIYKYKIEVRDNPDDAVAHYNLGLVYIKAKEYREALVELEEALRLDPKLAKARVGLGQVYLGLERWQQAIEEFNDGLAMDPEIAYAHNGLGQAYHALKDGAKAIVHTLRAEKLHDEHNDPEGRAISRKALREFYVTYGFKPEDFK
ncbi:MAG: tetratricopeptide repeat protein [Nitrospinales bacterium]